MVIKRNDMKPPTLVTKSLTSDSDISGTSEITTENVGDHGANTLREVFEIAEHNHIELCDTRERTMSTGFRTSLFYKETDTSNRVVAHYRVWTTSSSTDLMRTQAGFEKFSVKGELQDREVRFGENPLH